MQPIEITITQAYGTPPFYIEICDISGSPCYQIPPLTGVFIPPPFTFTVPPELSGSTDFKVIVIDSLGCESFQDIDLQPQGDRYIFVHIPNL